MTDSDQKLENSSSNRQVDTDSEQQDLEQIIFGVIDEAATYAVESDEIKPERIQAICDAGKDKVSAWHHQQLEAKTPFRYGHTESCLANFSQYCTCGARAKNKANAGERLYTQAELEAKVAEARLNEHKKIKVAVDKAYEDAVNEGYANALPYFDDWRATRYKDLELAQLNSTNNKQEQTE